MIMVVINVAIVLFLLQIAVYGLHWTGWLAPDDLENAARIAAGLLLLVLPSLVIIRQIQRASVGGTTVALSPSQFPELYATGADFAARLGLPQAPAIYLANGNGTLNAFAAQSGASSNYVVISNELFANLHRNNIEGLRFIMGHEMAHVRLSHVALWYQLSICFSGALPILGATLSRLREYSCDRNGAALEPHGERGLVMLTAGRYAHDSVVVSELVQQGKELGGFWVEFAQLLRSHPWTVRRLWRLYQLGLFGADGRGPRR
jgi:Zn-dependent protease with chaperone function